MIAFQRLTKSNFSKGANHVLLAYDNVLLLLRVMNVMIVVASFILLGMYFPFLLPAALSYSNTAHIHVLFLLRKMIHA